MGGQRFRAGGCYRIRIGKDTADAGARRYRRPSYFNIWNWILPKLTPAERGGTRGSPKPEAQLLCEQVVGRACDVQATNWGRTGSLRRRWPKSSAYRLK
jgi:hypothetical protein